MAVIKPGSAALYYIHSDHLDTPRLIANQTPATVWRWDNDDPFGANMANANPSGLGTFAFNLRLPGQYFDSETNYHYNTYRDYSPDIGRYIESDPIGLDGGLNTFAYAYSDPLQNVDMEGLEVRLICRPVNNILVKATTGYQHCFVYVTCPAESWSFTLSLFGNFPYFLGTSQKAIRQPFARGNPENPLSPKNTYNQPIVPKQPNCNCAYEKYTIGQFQAAPPMLYYGGTQSNSNTFSQYLITSPSFGTSLPPDAPANAPGFTR